MKSTSRLRRSAHRVHAFYNRRCARPAFDPLQHPGSRLRGDPVARGRVAWLRTRGEARHASCSPRCSRQIRRRPPSTEETAMPHEKQFGSRVEMCVECHATCTEAVDYCLRQGGRHASADHIRLLLDCAQACQTSADYMLRGSELHTGMCAVCADVCDRCAETCETMQDDARMARCAEVCRRCADSCRQMAGGTRIAHAA